MIYAIAGVCAVVLLLLLLCVAMFWSVACTECPECRLTDDWQPADSEPLAPGLYQREYSEDELNIFESDCDWWCGKEWHFTNPFGGTSVVKRRWRIV